MELVHQRFSGIMLFYRICFYSPPNLNLLYSGNIMKWKTCDINLCYELIHLCTEIVLTFVFFFITFSNIDNEKIFRNALYPNIYCEIHCTVLCRHVYDFRFFSLQQSFKKEVINIKTKFPQNQWEFVSWFQVQHISVISSW